MKPNQSKKIRFKLVNNLIVVPLELNGVKLSFVLDTGVSKPILFNIVNTDSLKIKQVETIFLQGLGSEGSIEALRSKRNLLRFGPAINVNQDVFVVFDNTINFTPRLGVPVHGIIGYDIFKDFVVEVNYGGRYIRLYKSEKFKSKNADRWRTLPINLYKRKPYLNAEVKIDSTYKSVKLLIDSGGSDALWLFKNEASGLTYRDDMFFEDYLGKGLSGPVYGQRSRLNEFKLADYQIKNVNVAFPDSSSLNVARMYRERSGSIAGNLLKRFNFIFDYRNKTIQFKKNKNFKAPFYYNNAGVVLEQHGTRLVKQQIASKVIDSYGNERESGNNAIELSTRYSFVLKPSFEIVDLRDNSNAKRAGLMLGDVITEINNNKTHRMTLQQVNSYFYDRLGKSISIRVERDGQSKLFRFKLDDVFKKKSPQIEGSSDSISKM
ncbi:aspartyl protease family protein [Winogradskyella maritima]|uniref:Aspartyl protease family protein n=1 Tax=Winogradskyella maritima TaxID=1517766 RepID=A0ABV8AK62_9FLAO|nr:aspartyl protease family protein [Winogradskyella maritima]